MLDLSRFVAEQRRAVLAPDGPLVIVAGPGSGKTTVLAARIAYLIMSRQTPPTSILALTFATKAARELRARLTGLLGPPGQAVDVMTFHAFGLRVIRQWSEELGLGHGPVSVYGESEARSLLMEAAERHGLPAAGLVLPDLVAGVTRLRLGVQATPAVAILNGLVREYERLLRQRGAVDYPAMLALPLRLFDSQPAALRLIQDAYRHVLVDEFQDVCGAQYELLRRLADRHRNLVVVGDPRQALYAWRGADVQFLRRLQSDFPETQVFTLDQNFRSTRQIVGLANALAESLGRLPPLWTDKPRRLGLVAEALQKRPGGREQLVALADRHGPTARQAAATLAKLICTLHQQALRLRPDQLLDLSLEKSGYRAWIERTPDADSDLRCLSDLRELAVRAESGLGDWLSELQLGEEPEVERDEVRRVLLTTIHGAKGGEWSVVFVVGVEEGLLSHARATAASRTSRYENLSPDEDGVLEELRVANAALVIASSRGSRRASSVISRLDC